MRARRLMMFALLALGAAAQAQARVLWVSQDDSLRLDFTGSVRETLSAGAQTDAADFAALLAGCISISVVPDDFVDCPAFGEVGEFGAVQSLTRLRTRFDLEFGRELRAVVVYDHEVRAGHLSTLEADLGRAFASRGGFDATDTIASGRHARWRHLLYRGHLGWQHGPLQVTLGRQRIAWGEGRLWNPIDRLNAIGPLAIESDQSGGVDALDVRWNFTGFNYLELVYAAARDSDDARYAARLHGILLDTDISLLGGVFEEAPTVGFDLSRNLGDAAFRIEAIWTDPERDVLYFGELRPREVPDFWQVVASIDTNLDYGTGVYLLFEHLYNGNALGFGRGRAGPLLPLFGAPGVAVSSDRFGTSQVISGARQQSGLMLGYDLTPEIRGEVLTLVDWTGGSALLFPRLSWSPLGEFELSLGGQFGFGPHLSEFGARGALGYVLAEWFF